LHKAWACWQSLLCSPISSKFLTPISSEWCDLPALPSWFSGSVISSGQDCLGSLCLGLMLNISCRVPLQSTFGRRPVLLMTTLICLASNIWKARATSYSSFMGACILNGIGGAPAEVSYTQLLMSERQIRDLPARQIRRHNRPSSPISCFYISEVLTTRFTFQLTSVLSMYALKYLVSIARSNRSQMGPIIAGPMAFHSNWRNFWWLNVALHGVIFVLILFLLPETLYHRVYETEIPSRSSTFEDKGLSQNTDGTSHIERKDEKSDIATVRPEAVGSVLVPIKTADRDPNLGKGRPSAQQFKIFQPNRDFLNSILQGWINPWKLFVFPIVQIAGIIIAWSASCFLAVNVTQSQNFAAPPYNYSSQTIGFMNFAVLIGTMIGLFTNGKLSDWVADIATRRNRGVREPEMRLPALIPYVGIMLIGNFVVAFGMEQKWDWKASLESSVVHSVYSWTLPYCFVASKSICLSVGASQVTSLTNSAWFAANCHCGLYMHWNSSCCDSGNCVNVCGRQLQACYRIDFRHHRHDQKSLGLWLL
jgi:hypothetical protein